MDGGIYLEQDGELILMTEHPYSDEGILQERLADSPRLLSGDQMNPRSPRDWLLIAREAGIPDHEDSGGRWSADHLFIDQDAIPTLIEVKRASDTRIRREVVGQILDYVSHACIYWDAETLESSFVDTWNGRGEDPAKKLTDLIGDDDPSQFWERAQANLRAKRVRILFVADKIPPELKRVVEFLNEGFTDVEVFAIEVAQFKSGDAKAFVPRLFGHTEEARGAKSHGSRPRHSEDDFLTDITQKQQEGELTDREVAVLRELYDFIKAEADDYKFGGTANVSVTALWDCIGGSTAYSLSTPVATSSSGKHAGITGIRTLTGTDKRSKSGMMLSTESTPKRFPETRMLDPSQ